MSQLCKWLTVVLDIVLTTLRKNGKTNSGETNSQNGMFKLIWRVNVNFTRTQNWLFIKVFERDLSKFFFVNSIKYNCFVLSKSVRNLNCELRHLRKFKIMVTALSEPFLDSYWFPIIFAKSIRKASLRLVAPSDATCAQCTKDKQINRNLSDI